MKPIISTCHGTMFDLMHPEQSHISICMIAHALSNLCRFTGHSEQFYSIAQHSLLVSMAVPEEFALEGLLHDAHEAFVGDVSSPLKSLLPDYRAVEDRVQSAVRDRFGVPLHLSPEVKHADLVLLATEKRDLMPERIDAEGAWQILNGIEPLPFCIRPYPPHVARAAFLERFRELTEKQSAPRMMEAA